MLNFDQIFHDYVQHDEKVWGHDRSKTLGASEAFSCLRQAWFKRFGEERGFEKDEGYEDTWGAAKRGDIIEDNWVVPAMLHGLPKSVGYELAGDDQKTFVYGKNSATPDGLLTNLPADALKEYGIDDIESDCVLLEIKSIDPRVTLDEEKAVHHGQAQVQMGILRRMTDYRPMYTVILYVDASFLNEISVYVVRYEPGKWKMAVNRAEQLFDAIGPSELRPEGKLTDECKFCAWKHACATVNGQGVPENDKMDDTTSTIMLEKLDELAEEREALKAEQKDLDTALEDLNVAIKDILKEIDSRKAVANSFKFSWIFQKGRATIDKEAMKADDIDPAKYEKRGPGFEKLTVTRIK